MIKHQKTYSFTTCPLSQLSHHFPITGNSEEEILDSSDEYNPAKDTADSSTDSESEKKKKQVQQKKRAKKNNRGTS